MRRWLQIRARWWASLIGLALMWLPTAAEERPAVVDANGAAPASISQTATPSPQQAGAPAAEVKPAPTTEEIAAWIADLDDNRYLVREAATQHLLSAGAGSLDLLLATANGGQPEPADRAVWILRRLGRGADPALRRQALERLTLVQNRPQVAAAARDMLIELRHNDAVEAIQRLGGRYDVSGEYGMTIGPHFLPRVVLDRQWRGGDEGLAHLRDLAAARTVVIIGADVSAAGLAQLQHVNQLDHIAVYGTKVDPDDEPNLKKLLPAVKLDIRRGGLLGVAAAPSDENGPAVVGTVPRGSAAEAAGIKVGDTVQKFEGEKVPNFRALTDMIGKYRAGAEVKLEVLRDGKPIEFTVKLGEWQSVDLVP